MPTFTIQDVRLEEVVKSPKNRYQVATVVYTTAKGEQKEKKVMSFANPQVFSTVKDLKSGTVVDVTYVEGDQYFNWAKCSIAAIEAAKPAVAGGKVLGNQYETREERILRQLHIVRQSSLSNAVALLSAGAKVPPKTEDVLAVAQEFVDFVYQNNETLLGTTSSEAEAVSEA